LVELSIVVVIVGILAVLAIVGYRMLIDSSHMAEATHMVQAIRVAQEAYHAETQTYVSTEAGFGSGNLYPVQNSPPKAQKTGWGAGLVGTCAPPLASHACWAAIPLHVDSAVMFGYATIGGQAGNPTFPPLPTINGVPLTPPVAAPTDWYFIEAMGDVNGNAVFSTVIGTSFNNDLFIDKEGE
jgi:type IV pilus assembly protein PilA